MHRRQFAAGAVAAGTTATWSGHPAFAKIRQDVAEGYPPFGHISLNFDNRVYVPQRLIVVSDNFAHEIGVDHKFALSNEERSGILNPTLDQQFEGSIDVGDVRLVGRDIIIFTSIPNMTGDLRLTDGEISFRINAEKLGNPFNGNLPVLGDVPVIGNLFRRKNDTEIKRNLMVLVRAEILDFAE